MQSRRKAAPRVRATLVSPDAAAQIFVSAGKPSKPDYLDVMARALRFIPQ